MTMMIRRATAAVRMRDGSLIDVRPVAADDKPLLVDGFSRMSERARYLRFLSPTERLSPKQLAYLSELDHHDHVAWGALDGDQAVAIGRWVRLDDAPAEADVAVTVIDSHQGKGLGVLMLRLLSVSARARGIGVFHFDVLSENRQMMALLERMGATIDGDGDLSHATIDVGTIDAPEVVHGDLIALLEEASRQASGD